MQWTEPLHGHIQSTLEVTEATEMAEEETRENERVMQMSGVDKPSTAQ